MRRLVEFPSESGEPILVEVEGVGLSGETRRGLSASTVVERAQTSFEDALEKARLMASLEDRARVSATFPLSRGSEECHLRVPGRVLQPT